MSSESLKRRDLDEGSGQDFRANSYNISNMRAANDLANLHFSAVLPDPSLLNENEGMKMKVHAKFYRLVQERLVLIAYAKTANP